VIAMSAVEQLQQYLMNARFEVETPVAAVGFV